MRLNEKNIFLLDGIGALWSMLLSGLILPNFSTLIGLSKGWLLFLASFPLSYAIFSFSCYRLAKPTKAWMLLLLMAANSLYCLLSATIIFLHPHITLWGKALLLGEIFVILFVITLERKIYLKVKTPWLVEELEIVQLSHFCEPSKERSHETYK